MNFNVGSLGGTANIQTIFDLVPRCLRHVWCHSRHSFLYAGFQVLMIVDLNLIDNVLHITPQYKSTGVKSGDLGGQVFRPLQSIDLPAISLSRWFTTLWQKCGGAPFCCRIVWGGNWGSASSPSLSKYDRSVTVFSKKKTAQSTRPVLSRLTRSLWGCLSPTHM
jgi:hypothetical protein